MLKLVGNLVQGQFNETVKFAKATGRFENFIEHINYLHNYAGKENTRCILRTDFAPYSFNFTMQRKQPDGSYKYWFEGGLIYHGPHDGYGSGQNPTLSVCVNPTDDWAIHT